MGKKLFHVFHQKKALLPLGAPRGRIPFTSFSVSVLRVCRVYFQGNSFDSLRGVSAKDIIFGFCPD